MNVRDIVEYHCRSQLEERAWKWLGVPLGILECIGATNGSFGDLLLLVLGVWIASKRFHRVVIETKIVPPVIIGPDDARRSFQKLAANARPHSAG